MDMFQKVASEAITGKGKKRGKGAKMAAGPPKAKAKPTKKSKGGAVPPIADFMRSRNGLTSKH